MDLFDEIQQIERRFEQQLIFQIQTHIQQKSAEQKLQQHNHPPQIGIVENCEYCKKFGNILEFGFISYEKTDINKHLFKCQ